MQGSDNIAMKRHIFPIWDMQIVVMTEALYCMGAECLIIGANRAGNRTRTLHSYISVTDKRAVNSDRTLLRMYRI